MEKVEKKYKNKEDYPLMLSPSHVQEIMNRGRKQTYDFLGEVEYQVRKNKNPPFHLIRIGKSIKIPRDIFFNWVEGSQ
jgi:hypothetical protein